MEVLQQVKDYAQEIKLYWKQPRPGEYVPYKEVFRLSIGWMALYMSINWSIGFGVGNQFTGMTLGMNNNQLLVMGYVCQAIGYILTPLNAWIIDNLRSKDGKYRVYIKLALPAMFLTITSLWLPYEQVRDANQPFTQYVMIAMLFAMGQIQGYVQSWMTTGVTNMVHVITPNTQERTKIMSITSIIYSMGYSINNLYYPIMVDLLTDMKEASKQRNTYGIVASPYLAAVRTIELAEGYENLPSITCDYDAKTEQRNLRYALERSENERIAEERRIDKERKAAQRRLSGRK